MLATLEGSRFLTQISFDLPFVYSAMRTGCFALRGETTHSTVGYFSAHVLTSFSSHFRVPAEDG